MLVGILIFCGGFALLMAGFFKVEKYLKKRMAVRYSAADMNQEDE